MRDCIVRVPPLTLFICSLTDSGDEPSLRTVLPDPKAPGVAVEATELQGAILLPFGVEDEQGDSLGTDLDLWQVLSLKRGKLGYLWLAGV